MKEPHFYEPLPIRSFFSRNMSLDSHNIFIEFDFMSNEPRLMKKVYRIHFYESS